MAKSALSKRQLAYLGANVFVHYKKGGKVNTSASMAKNRKVMKSSERKQYLQSRGVNKSTSLTSKGYTANKNKSKGFQVFKKGTQKIKVI